MTNINDLRKKHENSKAEWDGHTTGCMWVHTDIDALFAEIDRLTSENAALTRQAMRADSIASRALDLNDKVIKENAELRHTPASDAVPAATPVASEALSASDWTWLRRLSVASIYAWNEGIDGKYGYIDSNEYAQFINAVRKLIERGYVVAEPPGSPEDGEPVEGYHITVKGRAVLPPAPARAADDAAKAAPKLTARNSVILANIKKMFNARIYKAASIRANSEGEQAAIEMILKHYVREDRREAVSAALKASER